MLKTVIKNFSTAKEYRKSIKDALKKVDVSFKLNSRSKKRYAMCKICPAFNKLLRQCNACKCIMFLKVRILHEKCPLGKW